VIYWIEIKLEPFYEEDISKKMKDLLRFNFLNANRYIRENVGAGLKFSDLRKN
jgi:hypothetical protein